MTDHDLERIEPGARNLLVDCAGAIAGDHVLFVGEDADDPYFAPGLCNAVSKIANKLGMSTEVVFAKPVADVAEFPVAVRNAMSHADRTIFFSRLGDQVRFDMPRGLGKVVMTYTLDLEYLSAPFASASFTTMKRIHDALLSLILKSGTYRISGACGTDLTSEIASGSSDAVADFALDLFPVMIFPPLI